jgi:hypothetical protein
MPASILPGTLEVPILKAVSLGPQPGYGVTLTRAGKRRLADEFDGWHACASAMSLALAARSAE